MAPLSGPYAAVPGGSADHFRLDSTEELDSRDGNNSEAIDEAEQGQRSTERARRSEREAEDEADGDDDEAGLLGRAPVREIDQLEEELPKPGDGRRWYQSVSQTGLPCWLQAEVIIHKLHHLISG